MPDFTQYVPPGVYVDSGSLPTIAPTGLDPTVICLIGNGIGYHTYTETVSFANTSSVVLTQKGINVSSIVVTGRVTDPAAAGQTLPYTFQADVTGTPHDYSTTVDATAGVDKSVTTLVRTTTGKIETANPSVTVTYHYTDATYHALQAFDDFDNLQAIYGPALDPVTGAITSPLTLAASIAMNNGANKIYGIALNGIGSVESQFQAAYGLLQGNYEANIIVPLWSGVTTVAGATGFLQDIRGHVENDARDGYLRMAIVGFDKGLSPTNTELQTLGTTTNSSRVVIAWPNQLQIYNGILNSSVTVDGYYLAVAYAGMLAVRQPQMPLTRKYPYGFISMPTPVMQALTKSVKNQLSSSGLCVTEVDRAGRLIVRHGLTTAYAGGVITREISLIRAQDSLYNLIQQTLDNSGLIGTPIQSDTALRVKSVTSGGLELAMTQGLIIGYTNLKVRQQAPPSGDPTIIEVKFAYQPTYPLNYILVSFSIDTATGVTTLNAADATAISDSSTTAAAAR